MSSNLLQSLRDHLTTHPQVRADFETAFTEAKESGVTLFEDWDIDTLDDYLNYYERFLKWVPTEQQDGRAVYNHICFFYFVLDKWPMRIYQSPTLPSTHCPYTWISRWIIDYANEMGQFMDTPDSITEEAIKSFYLAPSYHMQDYEPEDWKTFNQFFARKINLERRPIYRPEDNHVIVSPADSTFDGTDLRKKFEGGKFCHSFLGPNDYHRLHAPVSGKVIEARVIKGLCYLEVKVVVDPKTGHRTLEMHRTFDHVAAPLDTINATMEAPNEPGYQFIQARALILIETSEIGLVAVLPIGMAQVSSVVLSVKEGCEVKKGDEIAYFQLGGSDVVMVFQSCANVKFTVEKDQWSAFGTEVARADTA
ncbi:phosphatidylserine decarboxylase-domain-containing protein [Trametes meyenii]|nr:phosphatidylserine decarboxylase-domain-containing protein [Trametes meyenii]